MALQSLISLPIRPALPPIRSLTPLTLTALCSLITLCPLSSLVRPIIFRRMITMNLVPIAVSLVVHTSLAVGANCQVVKIVVIAITARTIRVLCPVLTICSRQLFRFAVREIGRTVGVVHLEDLANGGQRCGLVIRNL